MRVEGVEGAFGSSSPPLISGVRKHFFPIGQCPPSLWRQPRVPHMLFSISCLLIERTILAWGQKWPLLVLAWGGIDCLFSSSMLSISCAALRGTRAFNQLDMGLCVNHPAGSWHLLFLLLATLTSWRQDFTLTSTHIRGCSMPIVP